MYNKDYTMTCEQWIKLPMPSGIQGQYQPNPNSNQDAQALTFGKIACRVKEQGADSLGCWSYQMLDGKGTTYILIISIYQCYKNLTNEIGITTYHQQKLMLLELDRNNTDLRRNLLRDLKLFLRKKLNDETRHIKPIILGDWNEECKGTSNSQKHYVKFRMVDIWTSIYLEEKSSKRIF